MKLLIPVASGLESVVKRQLTRLGYENARAQNGRISLEGDFSDIARLNVFLRSGERVLLCLGEFPASTFDELFEGVFSLPWEEYLSPHSQILMDGKSQKSNLGAIKAIGSVSKKAIVKRLIQKRNLPSHLLDEKGERVKVGVSLFENVATVTLDTSGEGLHKRGYRSLSYTAPLKETLAAALIDESFYFPEKPFADIFCGSGTLPIEAAMKSLKIAPGGRRSFDMESWRFFGSEEVKRGMRLAREEALSLEERGRKIQVFGSDINPKAISIAKYHAEQAGVGKNITFRVADMKEFSHSEKYGVLISNPPYGERLSSEEEVKELYRSLGKVFFALPDWNGYFLSGYPDFERYFGKRAEKKKKVYNANIVCGYFSYPGKKPPAREKEERGILTKNGDQ